MKSHPRARHLTQNLAAQFRRPLWKLLAIGRSAAAFVLASVFLAATALAAPFTPGNLVVLRADSATVNNTTATIVELDTDNAGQTPTNTIAIDGATAPNALRFSGSATSTGYLSRSADGSLVVFTGHNATTATGNANAILPRGVGTLDPTGTFALSTTYTGTGGNQARSATTLNNSTWFIADQGGIYTNGGSAASPTANVRSIRPFDGNVYVLQNSSNAAIIVVSTVSAPTGGTITGLPGLINDATAQDFYMVSSGAGGPAVDVLYVLTTAGVKKYSLVAGSWVSNGSYATVTGFGLVAAPIVGGADLYVSTGTGATAANNVVKLTDTAGHNAPINVVTANNVTLYTAPAGTTVKGVAFAPVAVAAQPDLTVGVTVPATSPINTNFDFTITASNIGGANATGVAIGFNIPAGLNFVSAAGTNGFTGMHSGGFVSFTGGDVNLGVDSTMTVTVTTAVGNVYTAPAGAALIDPIDTIPEVNEGNNASTAPATITVLAASNDANLASLVSSTGAYSPVFAAATTGYVQVVPNGTTSVAITPTVAEGTATVKVNTVSVPSGSPSAPISLNEGINTISTEVTAGDGTTTKTYTLTVVRQSAAVLAPGAIAFTGYNADDDDNLAFVALTDIPANTVIFVTDEEWNGTDWADFTEGLFAWVANANVPAGTIVTIDAASNIYSTLTPATSNLGTVIGIPDGNNNPGVSASDEALYAFQGTGALNANGIEVPTVFLALIANEDPAGGVYSLANTGLSEAAGTAVIFLDDDDGMRYKGPRNGQLNFADYLPLIGDRATNWETVGGGNGSDYVPFNTAPFTAGPTVLVTINDVSISEGDAGTTMLHFTVTRGNNSGAFTLQYTIADGTGPNAATGADNDYQAGSGPVSFTAGGSLTEQVTVLINGDTTVENNETLFVNLSGLASTVGNAVISDPQGAGTILTDDPAAPTITTHPASQSIATGSSVTLTVAANGFPVPTFQWYEGLSGDTTNPIGGATNASFTTPILLASANYWARATNSQGAADSSTAVLTAAFAAPYTNADVNILTRNGASWNPAGINVGGTQFINLGLQGVGRVPATAIDPATGESIGSMSDLQITGWVKNGDGSFSGTFHVLPDRGYNVTSPTTIFSNYAARINTFDFTFTPYTSQAPTTEQNQIAMTFTGSSRFTYDHDGNPMTPPVYSTGLLANGGVPLFGTTVPVALGVTTQSDGPVTDRLTLDSEGLILDSREGKAGSGWVGDEYGAFIYHFNAAKEIDGILQMPEALIPHAVSGGPISFIDVPANVDGRRVNQGVEAIAQSPDGKKLFALMQSATMQDSGSGNQGRFNTRLLVYDLSSSDLPTDPIAQYVIQLPRIDDTGLTTNGANVNRTGAQSAIVALNDNQLLILARDGNGRGVPGSASPVFKSILLADLSAATNIDGMFDAAGAAVAPGAVLNAAVTPMSWTEALNMIGRLDSSLAEVEKFGLNLQGGNGDINTICEKWEALGLVSANDPANPNDYFLFIGNDNDFLTGGGKYMDGNGVIQSYDAGLENDTVVLAYRVRVGGPELLVEQPAGNEIVNGGLFAFSANPSSSATKTFTVKNSGTSTLNIASIGVTGGDAADFPVDLTGTVLTLVPGAETTFGLTFNAPLTGGRTTTLQIISNDFDEGTFAVAVTGLANFHPTLGLPASPVVATATGPTGAIVNFMVTASDVEDGDLTSAAIADPTTGSLFPIGDTIVEVSVTDSDGATTTGSFTVHVDAPPPADPVFTTLLAKGGAVPNAGSVSEPRIQGGALWTGFGPPAVNDAGQIAYLGRWLAPAAAPLKKQTGAGIFVDDTLVAKIGEPVPGITGAVFKVLKDPVVDAGGRVAFIATITNATVGGTAVTPASDTVVMTNAFGSLEVLAREGAAAPGSNDAVFQTFNNVSIDGDTTSGVIFTAALLKGSGTPAAAPANDTGAWWRPAGAPALIKLIREGDAGFAGGETIKSFQVLKALAGSPGHARGQISGTQALMQVVTSTGRQSQVLAEPGTLTEYATGGGTLGGSTLPAATWSKMNLPSSGGGGVNISVLGILTPNVGGVTKATAKGIFASEDNGDHWEPVARVTDVAPGLGGGATFNNFKDPVNSATCAEVAFHGTVIGGGATPTTNDGLWFRPHLGPLTLVAREGSQPPGAPVGAQWKAFGSIALPGNESGPIFTANLLKGAGVTPGPGGITSLDDFALYHSDGAGVVRELVRENQPLLGKTVKTFNVLKAVAGTQGSARSFNDAGAVVLLVTFTDNTTQIVRIDLHY